VIVLDTTILVYAVGAEHPLRGPCRRILRALAGGDVDAATTVEVIQEFVHVRARRRGRADAIALARDYAAALRLLSTSADDLELGLSLYARHEDLGAFDSVLAATAMNQRATALISADRAFSMVPGLAWLEPDNPSIETLLR
jgi:uncharacterized protein